MKHTYYEGEVVHWNAQRGYGFVRRDDGVEPNVFIPMNEAADKVIRSYPVGARIRFKIRRNATTGKLQATATRLVQDASIQTSRAIA